MKIANITFLSLNFFSFFFIHSLQNQLFFSLINNFANTDALVGDRFYYTKASVFAESVKRLNIQLFIQNRRFNSKMF